MKFIEKNYPSILIFMVAICIAILVKVDCHGQSYTFSQKNGKAINVGTATMNGEYTLSMTYCADDSAHFYQNGGMILIEFGANRLYFEAPHLVFTTQYDDHGITKDDVVKFELVDVIGYSVLMDKKPHKLIIRKSANKKEVLIDNILCGSELSKPQASFTNVIWMGSGRVDYKLSGTISDFKYSPSFDVSPNELPQPKGTIDTLEYASGYIPFSNDWRNVPSPTEQYDLYATPPYHKKNYCEYHSLMIELKYMSGYNPQVTNDYNKIAQTGKTLSTQLALKFHCGFRVSSNLNALYSDVTSNQFSFDLAVMDTAKYYPNIPKDIGTAMSQSSPIPPYNPYPLQNITSTTPLSILYPNRVVAFKQGQLLKAELEVRGISINGLRHTENREVMGWMGGGLTGTEIFNTNYNYFLDSMRSLFPNIYTTGYDIYSMYFWNENGLKWPQVLQMTNTNRSTISLYMEYQKIWKTKTWGEKRGGDFRDASLQAELATGNKTSTPYPSPGWNGQVEKNMQPSNFAGMLGIYIVEGATFFYPAFFTIGGTGIQDPKSYCYIPAMCAYAQAFLSHPLYWDIITKGELLQGTTGAIGDFNQWSGSIEIKTVARKYGALYLIATTHQKWNVWNYSMPRKLNINPTIDRYNLPIFTRPQTTYWFFDSSKPIDSTNPKHLTSSFFRGHPLNWKSTNNLQD